MAVKISSYEKNHMDEIWKNSPLRENLTNWYPMKDHMQLLEIDAACEFPKEAIQNALNRLAADERLLLAVDNRLGLKYFSGAAAPDSGRYFEGIRGGDSVRAYSKSELIRLLEEVGCEDYRFYYPYPDHRFPTEIFTDKSIYEMGYGKFYFNTERNRFHFFDEPAVNKVLREERVAANFANSFLVEISKSGKITPNVQYVKMNSDRDRQFRIMTVIGEENNEKYVIKQAAVPEANAHIRKMYENDHKEQTGAIRNLKGTLLDGMLIGVKYPFLKEITLERKFGRLAAEGNITEATVLVKKVFETAFLERAVTKDYCSEEFQKVFGPETSKEPCECVRGANIDVIFDNLFETADGLTAIDCEWVFDFPIPLNFIKWRTTNELFIHYVQLSSWITKEAFDEQLGISLENGELYKKWAQYFVYEYIGGNRIEKYAEPMIGNNLELQYESYKKSHCLCSKLYVDYGEGFSETVSFESEDELQDGNFTVSFRIENAGMVKRLRWDPVDDQCVRIYGLTITGEPKRDYEEIVEENGTLFIVTADPKIYLDCPNGCESVITICGYLEYVPDAQKQAYLKNIWEVHQRNRHILEKLEKFYQTKLFRGVRKLYRIIKNKG